MIKFLKNTNSVWKKVAGILLFYILFSATITIFAAPPTTKYLPGDTLDPSCAPGDTNCTTAVESAVVNFTTITSADSPYSVLSTDQVIYADTSSGDIEVTLPSIPTVSEKRTIIVLKTATSNTLSINSASGDYVNETTAIYITDNKRAVRIESIKANQWLAVPNFQELPVPAILVKAGTISNLASTYDNGASGVGATLTASPSVVLPNINGVSLSVGERVLVKEQTDAKQNGVYEVTQTTAPWILTRTTDADEDSEMEPQIVIATQGTTLVKGKQFSQQTPSPTLGTSNITYLNIIPSIQNLLSQETSGYQVSGQIPFWTTTSRQLSKGSSNLFWDNTNKRLGINTSSPGAVLQVSPIANDADSLFAITGTTSPDAVAGGGVSITTSNGGNDNSSVAAGGKGGSFVVTTGNGGTGGFGPPTQGGNGGDIILKGGSGGWAPSTAGTGGEIFLIGGAGAGSSRNGNIFLGADEAANVRGNVVIGMSSGFDTSTKLQVYSSVHDGSDFYSASFLSDGNDANRYGILVQAGLDDQSSVGPSTLVQFKDGDGTAVGSITFGSNTTSYNTSSDQRLKENIVNTSLTLEDLMEVKIRDFNWIADGDEKLAHGVIAQELYDVYPGAVTVPIEEDKYWMVDYSKLTPLVIKAVQDLNLKVDSMSAGVQSTGITIGSVISYLEDTTNKTINGIITFFEIVTDKITTKKLCVEDVCVTKDEFLELLNQNNITPVLDEEPVVENIPEEIPDDEGSIEEIPDDEGSIEEIPEQEIEETEPIVIEEPEIVTPEPSL